MNREDANDRLARLAPPAPPCFESRLNWLEWLGEAWKPNGSTPETKPLIRRLGKFEFNHRIDFCSDCLPAYRAAMAAARRCRPTALIDNAGAEAR